MPVENMSMADARKQIDKSKDKLQLIVARGSSQPKSDADASLQQLHERPGKPSVVALFQIWFSLTL